MALSKHASWMDAIKGIAKNPYAMAVGLPVLGAAADAGIGAGIRHVRGVMELKHKAQAYKDMVAENPVLKKKGKDTHKFFNTLYNANPDLAKDPLVASSWVHTQLEQQIPGVPHAGVVEGVSNLTKIRQQMRGQDGGRRGPGVFQQAASNLGQNWPAIQDNKLEQQRLLNVKAQQQGEERLEGKTTALMDQARAVREAQQRLDRSRQTHIIQRGTGQRHSQPTRRGVVRSLHKLRSAFK